MSQRALVNGLKDTLTVSNAPRQIKSTGLIRDLRLRVRGTVTIGTATNNTAAKLLKGDHLAAYPNFLLRSANREIINASLEQLFMLSYFRNGAAPDIASATLGVNSVTAGAWDTVVPVEFCEQDTDRPILTALDASLSQGQLTAQATISTAGTDLNADATAAYAVAPSLEIYAKESGVTAFSAKPDVAIAQRAYAPGSGVHWTPQYLTQRQTFSATGVQKMQLRNGPVVRALLINVQTLAPATDQTGHVTNVKVRLGNTVLHDEPWAVTTGAASARTYGLEQATRVMTSTAHLVKGWAFLDFAHDGKLTECPNTNTTDEFAIDFTVGTACTVDVLTVGYIPGVPVSDFIARERMRLGM